LEISNVVRLERPIDWGEVLYEQGLGDVFKKYLSCSLSFLSFSNSKDHSSRMLKIPLALSLKFVLSIHSMVIAHGFLMPSSH